MEQCFLGPQVHWCPNPRANESVTWPGKRNVAHGTWVTDLRWETVVDGPGGPVTARILRTGRWRTTEKRWQQKQRLDWGRALRQGLWPASRSSKKEADPSLEPPEGGQACYTSPVRPLLTTELWDNKCVLCEAIWHEVTCYSSPRKLIQAHPPEVPPWLWWRGPVTGPRWL